MNKERRKRIAEVSIKLAGLSEELQDIRDEEQESFDNLPESIQCGSKGEGMESTISLLDDAIDSLAGVESQLDEAQE